MRKIFVLSFITMDGVMQAPGGPQEDPSGNFKYGGWSVNYFDDFLGREMGLQMDRKFDLLLGRKTYDIFASYWPFVDNKEEPGAAGINNATKYVVTRTLEKSDWAKTIFIRNNIVEQIKALKEENGPEIQVHGSGNLIQTLLQNYLVDELWLKYFPVVLGQGKKLFAEGTVPAAFELIESKVAPSGVIIANYKRAGEVKTGSFGL